MVKDKNKKFFFFFIYIGRPAGFGLNPRSTGDHHSGHTIGTLCAGFGIPRQHPQQGTVSFRLVQGRPVPPACSRPTAPRFTFNILTVSRRPFLSGPKLSSRLPNLSYGRLSLFPRPAGDFPPLPGSTPFPHGQPVKNPKVDRELHFTQISFLLLPFSH